MVDSYRHNKSFIAQIIEEHGVQKQAILDKLDFLDDKYEALVKTIWGMLVMEQHQKQGGQTTAT